MMQQTTRLIVAAVVLALSPLASVAGASEVLPVKVAPASAATTSARPVRHYRIEPEMLLRPHRGRVTEGGRSVRSPAPGAPEGHVLTNLTYGSW